MKPRKAVLPTSVRLTADLLAFLDEEAARTRRSRNDVIEQYLVRGIRSGPLDPSEAADAERIVARAREVSRWT
jgi:predicted transcriptional regulator